MALDLGVPRGDGMGDGAPQQPGRGDQPMRVGGAIAPLASKLRSGPP
jgi:hypothetical protein